MGNGGLIVPLFALCAVIWNAAWLPGVAADFSDKGFMDEDVIGEVVQPGLPSGQSFIDLGRDCYVSPMSVDGLQCDREGYFITDFGESVWWDPGQLFPQDWLRVPASQAMCCRPELSGDLEGVLPLGPDGQQVSPVGIITVGCHASTNTGMRAMQCETEGNSFITGFLNSLSPLRAPQTFYPIDGPECCTPVVLLDSGDAWSIERCDCAAVSGEISCNVEQTGRMLWGFEFCGKTGEHVVPLAPAMCCKLCMGKKLHSLTNCVDQNNCSGNGACTMGSCSCRPGFAGEDCSTNLKSKKGTKWWQSFWWLVVIGFLCAFMGLFATFWLIQRAEWGSGNRSNRSEEVEDPLLDAEGSAGSIDTRSEDSVTSVQINIQVSPEVHGPSDNADPAVEGDGVESARVEERGIRISTRIRRRTGDADGYVGDDDVYATPPTSLALTSPGEHDSPRNLDEEEFDRASDTEAENDSEPLLRENLEGPGTSAHFERSAFNRAQTSLVSDEDQEGAEIGEEEAGEDQVQKDSPMLAGGSEQDPLGRMACAICFSRPVQVALVPCGHSNICRRCSRKLERCPFCRKEVVRRQKLFLTN
ncbi:hypothetical protein BSKO_12789 [Bryopsis sp. KO-2023]|nr:hypothetical protein BSKO_12789 [Bryopsis sp. KO-2023]